FPPYPGVGGRRWAKFAKYLAEDGYEVHVISAENPFDEKSLFSKDTINPRIHNFILPAEYPAVLVKPVKRVLDKILYRFYLNILKLATKGNYHDRGVLWKKSLNKKASEVIEKHGIRNVVVTGAPFSILHHCLDLKLKHPSLNLIGDMRDPWTWGTGYGMGILSFSRKQVEEKMEREVLNGYNSLTVPSTEMQSFLNQKYDVADSKVSLIPHAYDETEIGQLPKSISQKCRLLFYGTLYPEISSEFRKLSEALSKNPSISLEIYSGTERYLDYFSEDVANRVNYHPSREPSLLFQRFADCDYVLVIQPDFAKEFITTKIYEIIYSGTPILLISSPGKLSDFIKANKLGIHIEPENINDDLHKAVSSTISDFRFSSFPIEDFSFRSVTKQLIALFR
ncbi:MAG: hypothetical protein M3R27_10375, partial [Bacteroidota bacterium]|nr:hypothetical protein [Bacteroidota bacterium]